MNSDKEKNRQLIQYNLQSKNIIIMGVGTSAKQFYMQYRDKCKIKKCVSTLSNPPMYLIDEDEGLKVIRWADYQKDKNDFLIVCEVPYGRIENLLTACGMVLFEDYVEYMIADFLLSGKKLALFAGNCQLVTVFDFMKEISVFRNEYYMLRFSTHYWASRWSLKVVSVLKNMCDLYVCMNHEEDDWMYFKTNELPETCRILTVPYVPMRIYWPQMSVSEGNFFLKNPKTNQHGPFEMADKNINRMLHEGKSYDEIIQTLSNENFYSYSEANEMLEKSFNALEEIEWNCDVKLLSYIKNNYTKELLYRDMLHMQPILVCEVVKQILQCLELDINELIEIKERQQDIAVWEKYQSHCTEVPIYPSVAKALGLEWVNKDTKYDVTFYNGIRKLTFEEYIREYYDMCSLMKKIQEEW